MNTPNLLSYLRNEILDDSKEEYLWSDSTLITNMSEAEREVCVRALVLKDRSTRYLSGSDISFDAATKTIASGSSGLGSFLSGMTITVYGSGNNDGSYTVVTSGAASLIVAETLVDEVAGAAIQIYCPLTHILLKNGIQRYYFSDKVMMINRLRSATGNSDIIAKTELELDQIWTGWRDAEGTEPIYYVHEDGSSSILVVPKPVFDPTSTTVLVTAEVSRYPYKDLIAASGSPEIPSQYHLSMLDYAAYLCYKKHDAETDDNSRMRIHIDKFTEVFGERPTAKAIEIRKRPRNARMYGKEFGAY